jgi:hypothetical protein
MRKGVTFRPIYISIKKTKVKQQHKKHHVMLDRDLTLIYQRFVLVCRQIFILFVIKCNFGPETARKPVKEIKNPHQQL